MVGFHESFHCIGGWHQFCKEGSCDCQCHYPGPEGDRLRGLSWDGLIPGPLPEREDKYKSNDPEPWVRPFSGERAAHDGSNLHGSGYIFAPRPEFDDPKAFM